MINTEPIIKKDVIEQHQEQKQRQEYKFLGTVIIRKGLKMFEYNSEKDTMKEVRTTEQAIGDLYGNTIKNKKALANSKYLYFQALNERNARRKLKQFKEGNYTVSEQFETIKTEQLPKYF